MRIILSLFLAITYITSFAQLDQKQVQESLIYSVEERLDFTTAEPTTPVAGQYYYNTTTGSSNVTATVVNTGSIYLWSGTSWIEKDMPDGSMYTDKSSQVIYVWDQDNITDSPAGGGLTDFGETTSDSDQGAGLYKLNSSSGAFTFTLPAATGTGGIRKFYNSDVTNPITLVVEPGESLNHIVDETFLFSNYPKNTFFEVVDESVGNWAISVIGASATQEMRKFVYQLGDRTTNIASEANNVSSYTDPDAEVIPLVASGIISNEGNLATINDANNSIVFNETGVFDFRVEIDVFDSLSTNSSIISIYMGDLTNEVKAAHHYTPTGDYGYEVIEIKDFQATAGVEYDFRFGNVAGEGVSVRQIRIFLEDVATDEVVLAGMVTPEPLSYLYGQIPSTTLTNNLDLTFDNEVLIGSNISGTQTINLAANKLYELKGQLSVNTSGRFVEYQFHNGTEFIGTKGVLNSFDNAADGGNSIAIAYVNEATVQNITLRVVDTDGTSPITQPNEAFVSIEEKPISNVVNPDDVPVEDIETLIASGITVADDATEAEVLSGYTWNQVVSEFEYIDIQIETSIHSASSRVHVDRITSGNTIEVPMFDTRYALITIDGDLSTSDFTVQYSTPAISSTITSMELRGVRAQKTVINSNDEDRTFSYTEVNTNRDWVDGKPIYRQVFDLTGLPVTSTLLTGVDEIIGWGGSAITPISGGGTTKVLVNGIAPFGDGDDYFALTLFSGGNLGTQVASNGATITGNFISGNIWIEYTKQ